MPTPRAPIKGDSGVQGNLENVSKPVSNVRQHVNGIACAATCGASATLDGETTEHLHGGCSAVNPHSISFHGSSQWQRGAASGCSPMPVLPAPPTEASLAKMHAVESIRTRILSLLRVCRSGDPHTIQHIQELRKCVSDAYSVHFPCRSVVNRGTGTVSMNDPSVAAGILRELLDVLPCSSQAPSNEPNPPVQRELPRTAVPPLRLDSAGNAAQVHTAVPPVPHDGTADSAQRELGLTAVLPLRLDGTGHTVAVRTDDVNDPVQLKQCTDVRAAGERVLLWVPLQAPQDALRKACVRRNAHQVVNVVSVAGSPLPQVTVFTAPATLQDALAHNKLLAAEVTRGAPRRAALSERIKGHCRVACHLHPPCKIALERAFPVAELYERNPILLNKLQDILRAALSASDAGCAPQTPSHDAVSAEATAVSKAPAACPAASGAGRAPLPVHCDDADAYTSADAVMNTVLRLSQASNGLLKALRCTSEVHLRGMARAYGQKDCAEVDRHTVAYAGVLEFASNCTADSAVHSAMHQGVLTAACLADKQVDLVQQVADVRHLGRHVLVQLAKPVPAIADAFVAVLCEADQRVLCVGPHGAVQRGGVVLFHAVANDMHVAQGIKAAKQVVQSSKTPMKQHRELVWRTVVAAVYMQPSLAPLAQCVREAFSEGQRDVVVRCLTTMSAFVHPNALVQQVEEWGESTRVVSVQNVQGEVLLLLPSLGSDAYDDAYSGVCVVLQGKLPVTIVRPWHCKKRYNLRIVAASYLDMHCNVLSLQPLDVTVRTQQDTHELRGWVHCSGGSFKVEAESALIVKDMHITCPEGSVSLILQGGRVQGCTVRCGSFRTTCYAGELSVMDNTVQTVGLVVLQCMQCTSGCFVERNTLSGADGVYMNGGAAGKIVNENTLTSSGQGVVLVGVWDSVCHNTVKAEGNQFSAMCVSGQCTHNNIAADRVNIRHSTGYFEDNAVTTAGGDVHIVHTGVFKRNKLHTQGGDVRVQWKVNHAQDDGMMAHCAFVTQGGNVLLETQEAGHQQGGVPPMGATDCTFDSTTSSSGCAGRITFSSDTLPVVRSIIKGSSGND